MRHLPWELLARDGAYLAVSAHSPLLAVRAAVPSRAGGGHAGNRPLRVLFMATSPEGVEPVLSYEAEEAAILAATADTGTELVVEESGTLEGLRFTAESYGAGISMCCTSVATPRCRTGARCSWSRTSSAGWCWPPPRVARAMAGQWPRLVFVSGCFTGNAPERGTIPSMSESLVRAGAPLVLGWALPVGDISATEFAAELYRALAAGQRLDRSMIAARQQLYASTAVTGICCACTPTARR